MNNTKEHTMAQLDDMVNTIMEKCMFSMQTDKKGNSESFDDLFDDLTAFKSRTKQKLDAASMSEENEETFVEVLNDIDEAERQFVGRLKAKFEK